MGICLIAVCNAVASSRPPLDCPPPLCDVIVLEWEKPGDGGLGGGGGGILTVWEKDAHQILLLEK